MPEETPQESKTIGRYRILSELGRGSMARVYLAMDPNIDRKVALKVLDPRNPTSQGMVDALEKRFLIEATAAARLDHPCAVAIYDADVDSETGDSYIAMEWIDGESLRDRLAAGGPLPLTEAIDIVRQVAGALDAAHRQGLIHRDVKPANILINRQGRAKLSDFGIAKLDDLELTTTGQVLGTPLFMSPEQIRDDDLDGRSDLFSLGVVLYQSLTGEPPFAGETLPSVTHKIMTTDPRPVRELSPHVPEELAGIVERLLAKDREERFATAAELAQALARSVGQDPVADGIEVTRTTDLGLDQTLPAPPPGQTLNPQPPSGRLPQALPVVVAFLMMAVLVLLVGLRLQSRKPALPPETQAITASDDRVLSNSPGASSPDSDVVQSDAVLPPPGPNSSSGRSPADSKHSRAANAHLEILHTNRLKKGWLTVWIDGDRVASRPLSAPKGLAKRVSGEDVRLSVPVRPGQRRLEIRISGAEGKVGATKQTDVYLSSGQTKRLRVGWLPTGNLRFTWK
ncbi:MAG: protein kinase [Thermoanaerobaculia bacterium]|jgi:serine/threonine protein kinase